MTEERPDKVAEKGPGLSEDQQNVLRVVCYYDVFNHPLTVEEILMNSVLTCTLAETQKQISELVMTGILREKDGYYMLNGTGEDSVIRRKEGEERHRQALDRIKHYSNRIAGFPFVRGVYVSGSYSKGVLKETDDYDYFIITASKRLWLCRSLLRGYKKFFLRQSEKYFCMNYFLEEGNLEVPDHNLFVATEVRTLVPAFNLDLYTTFQKSNEWVNVFLPNRSLYTAVLLPETSVFRWKRRWEAILNGSFGHWLELRLFNFMNRRRRKKFSHFSEEEFNLNMRTQQGAEKHHPGGTQQRVLSEYARRLHRYGISD